MEEKKTIEEKLKSIIKRLEDIRDTIYKALEENKQFNDQYYNYSVECLKPGSIFQITDDYVIYDIFGRYKPKSDVIFIDSIFLDLNQLDEDKDVLEEVSKFFESIKRQENE